MKGYSTKYALTRGIQKVEIDEEYSDTDSSYLYTQKNEFGGRQQLRSGSTFFETKDAAISNAMFQARKKVLLLQKQLRDAYTRTRHPKWE